MIGGHFNQSGQFVSFIPVESGGRHTDNAGAKAMDWAAMAKFSMAMPASPERLSWDMEMTTSNGAP